MRFMLFFLMFAPLMLFSQINIAVSILPQKTFFQKIAGDLANVTVMVAPGASPATYEPKPSQMRSLTQAQLYFAIGVPFEKSWLSRFAAQNRSMKIVDTSAGIKKLHMHSHHHGHHHDGHECGGSTDPHIWLSPRLVKVVVQNMIEALEEIDPKNAEIYRRNGAIFKREIDELDERLKKILAPCKGEVMMVFHPSWGYFAKDYGLKQLPIEVEGKEPKSKKLLELTKLAKKEGVKSLFIQPQFSKRSASIIASSIGAKVLEADPLAADWSKNLLEVAKKICENR